MSEFPKRFMWGISMAAFQYEMGASQESLDPNSDWYMWVHDRKNIDSKIVSGDFPEHGPGYWDLYKKDHDWAEWMGLNTWRMNPEWSRIFPKPTTSVRASVYHDDEGIKDVEVSGSALRKLDELANKNAVKRYREIFRDIKARGMKLILNLYHWPLPTWVHDPIRARDTGLKEGPRGWVDNETVVEFAKFAAYVAWKFQDIPDMWSTMNEPSNVWSLGYLGGSFPPGVMEPKAAEQAAFNMVQAHARAYDQIKRIVGKNAKVGVIYIVSPGEPLTDSEQDREAVKLYHEASVEWFFKAVLQGVVEKNLDGGEINRKDMKDKVDWIGVNYYTRNVIKHIDRPPYFQGEANYGFSCQPRSKSAAGRPTSEFGWEIYPEGMRKALNICGKYGKPLMITENGIADIKDKHRPWYLVSHLHNVWLAIKEDKLNIIGYLHWSLIDNFEWAMGFSKRFGLIHVDMNTKKRTPRPSAYIYRDIIENNALPEYLEEYSKYPNAFC
ncbi:MAG: beta-galactosidase BgaS [Thermoproteota archaeon]|nr:glycoside hydrolase family 1 protein [Candidatus Brockarchaeota archaeon]